MKRFTILCVAASALLVAVVFGNGQAQTSGQTLVPPIAGEKSVVESPAVLNPPPATGNPATGAALYEQCAPCHQVSGKGIAGKTEGELMAAMQKYQKGTFAGAKVQAMQKLLQGLSQQQLLDLSAYISKM